ncbi:unnamed protein product [Fraxinus pennsylvanica]|uniref:Uncharacterized protein n=1 Tax=Fraxinus pennsylvanica TaxID=56036 RepID=A0AAD2AH56_9LAMI|nr:unnamed protein product [Fraxinus pennsylvanica]
MTAPPPAVTAVSPQPPPANNNVDYLFGLEKGVRMAPQLLQKVERIEEQQGVYRRRNDENLVGGFVGGDYYKVPEKLSPVFVPSGPPGYWQEKQFTGGVFPASNINTE